MTDAAESTEPSAAEYVALKVANLPGINNVVAKAGLDGGIDIAFDGWSPTLHAAHVVLAAPTTPVAAGISATLRAAVNAQFERGKDARRLGIVEPIQPVSALSAAPLPIDHLSMDRSVVALLREAGRDPVQIARQAVTSLHKALVNHDGGTGIHYPVDNIAVAEATDAANPGQPHRMVLVEATCNSGRVTTNGLSVTVDLPPFKALLAQGFAKRRVRDLIEIHPALDDRIISGAQAQGNGRETTIFLVPDPVPVAGLLDTAAA